MRGLMLCAALCSSASLAGAEEASWDRLSGAEIVEVLTGRVIAYEAAWQDFRASGRTLYNAGADSWGYWAVRDDLYCSMWPPSDLWACYGVARSGDRVRFIGESGDISEGVLSGTVD